MKRIKKYHQFYESEFVNEEVNIKRLIGTIALGLGISLYSCNSESEYDKQKEKIELKLDEWLDKTNPQIKRQGGSEIQFLKIDSIIGPFNIKLFDSKWSDRGLDKGDSDLNVKKFWIVSKVITDGKEVYWVVQRYENILDDNQSGEVSVGFYSNYIEFEFMIQEDRNLNDLVIDKFSESKSTDSKSIFRDSKNLYRVCVKDIPQIYLYDEYPEENSDPNSIDNTKGRIYSQFIEEANDKRVDYLNKSKELTEKAINQCKEEYEFCKNEFFKSGLLGKRLYLDYDIFNYWKSSGKLDKDGNYYGWSLISIDYLDDQYNRRIKLYNMLLSDIENELKNQ